MLKTFNTTLIEKKQLTSDIVLLKFSLERDNELVFAAGQYMILKINELSRLYSIFSASNIKNYFELLIKIIPGGQASTYLNNLKIGDKTIFRGPAGAFTFKINERNKIFLATGTGITPIRSIIFSHLRNSGPTFYLFWGLPYFSEVCLFEELSQLSKNYSNFNFYICLSREKDLNMVPKLQRKNFVLGRINIGLDKLLCQKSINDSDYYLCGSKEVVESLRNYLYQKGANKKNVFFENFGSVS